MRRYDLNKKCIPTHLTEVGRPIDLHQKHPQGAILETCSIWDTDYMSDNWKPEFMTIFVTWYWTVDTGCRQHSIFYLVVRKIEEKYVCSFVIRGSRMYYQLLPQTTGAAKTKNGTGCLMQSIWTYSVFSIRICNAKYLDK